ncbi:magnesium/cobalt transporter CorA [Halalkalicoccus jeotgali]|uniref:Magnesium transport protein CorA n=1 Tax=Halalkalicoccus jeotgali (strain DSM 18796 / CECT 7217 / JCM 14584 / KCTC 4019 / B3) TaxID=795797 RepID=D8J7K2_HALJB|nr:magnesium/cobalt transporter CorA [Halalkalicoccus jeotgali]ADJ16022.1 magnesium and cobalt transport protein CorA [Halalkalicoccus jeotgali B3]ELY38118.1 magnesium and cobalt transport protein CorA [Halalkalicoccus jeotgali B3]
MIRSLAADGSRPESLAAAREAERAVWVRVTDATPADLDRVAETFGIHPLAVEDLSGVARPKTEEYPEYTFVLLKIAELAAGETSFGEELAVDPLGICIGDDWLVTFSFTTTDACDRAWRTVESDGRVLARGSDFVASRIVDGVTDEYLETLDSLESRIEIVEESVMTSTDIETLERLNSLRRELLVFRKLVWPTREAVGALARGDPDHVRPETEKYFRDVSDRLVHLVELTETYRDLVGGARDIYLNTISQSTNEVMKRLTVVATIVLPLTFVVGVYGMNFETMPELGWTGGYFAVMLGMAGLTLVLADYFRRQNYL